MIDRDQLHEVEKGKVSGPALSSQAQAVLQAGGRVAGKLARIKGLVDVGQ